MADEKPLRWTPAMPLNNDKRPDSQPGHAPTRDAAVMAQHIRTTFEESVGLDLTDTDIAVRVAPAATTGRPPIEITLFDGPTGGHWTLSIAPTAHAEAHLLDHTGPIIRSFACLEQALPNLLIELMVRRETAQALVRAG